MKDPNDTQKELFVLKPDGFFWGGEHKSFLWVTDIPVFALLVMSPLELYLHLADMYVKYIP